MATGINKVILIGNLGKDPEVKYSASGVQVAKFPLATSESIKRGDNWEEKTEWHNIVLFNKSAESAGQYLKKGMTIYLEGKISTSSWEDESGVRKYRTEIIGQMFRNLTKRDKTEAGQYQNYNAPKNTPANSPVNTNTVNEPENDLPF